MSSEIRLIHADGPTRYYFARYAENCLVDSPWGGDTYECVITDLTDGVLDHALLATLATEIPLANLDIATVVHPDGDKIAETLGAHNSVLKDRLDTVSKLGTGWGSRAIVTEATHVLRQMMAPNRCLIAICDAEYEESLPDQVRFGLAGKRAERDESLQCPFCMSIGDCTIVSGWGTAWRVSLNTAIFATDNLLTFPWLSVTNAPFALKRTCNQCHGRFFARSRPVTKAECARCGYDLRANMSGVCPECGWEADTARATASAMGRAVKTCLLKAASMPPMRSLALAARRRSVH